MSPLEARRISVVKRSLSPRDGSLADPSLTGLMTVKCEVSCRPESFLHIGTGSIAFRAEGRAIAELVDKSRTFEDLVRELRRAPDLARHDYLEALRLRGAPAIPGSTVKGACRARVELSIVASGGQAPSGFRQSTPPREPPEGAHGWRHFRVWSPSTWEDRGPDCDLTKSPQACLTCDVFGAPGLASRVNFGDMMASELQLYELELDHGERVEAVGPGSTFRGEASFSWLRPHELGLVLVGLGAKEGGDFIPVLLGRSKYRKRRIVSSNPRGWEGREVRFGVVRFSLEQLRLVRLHRMPDLPGGYEERGGLVVFRGEPLREFISWLVDEAKSKVPGLRVGYSELEELLKLEEGEGR